jgi:hypothetical protein
VSPCISILTSAMKRNKVGTSLAHISKCEFKARLNLPFRLVMSRVTAADVNSGNLRSRRSAESLSVRKADLEALPFVAIQFRS